MGGLHGRRTAVEVPPPALGARTFSCGWEGCREVERWPGADCWGRNRAGIPRRTNLALKDALCSPQDLDPVRHNGRRCSSGHLSTPGGRGDHGTTGLGKPQIARTGSLVGPPNHIRSLRCAAMAQSPVPANWKRRRPFHRIEESCQINKIAQSRPTSPSRTRP